MFENKEFWPDIIVSTNRKNSFAVSDTETRTTYVIPSKSLVGKFLKYPGEILSELLQSFPGYNEKVIYITGEANMKIEEVYVMNCILF